MVQIRSFFFAFAFMSALSANAMQPLSFTDRCTQVGKDAAASLWRITRSSVGLAKDAALAHVGQHKAFYGKTSAALLGAYVVGRTAYSLWNDYVKTHSARSGTYSLWQIHDLLFPDGGDQCTHIYQWGPLRQERLWPNVYAADGTIAHGAGYVNRKALPVDIGYAIATQEYWQPFNAFLVTIGAHNVNQKLTDEIGELRVMLGAIRDQAEFKFTRGNGKSMYVCGYGNVYRNICNRHVGAAGLADQLAIQARMQEGPSLKARIFGWFNILNPFVKSKLFMKTAYDLCWEIQRRINLLQALQVKLGAMATQAGQQVPAVVVHHDGPVAPVLALTGFAGR